MRRTKRIRRPPNALTYSVMGETGSQYGKTGRIPEKSLEQESNVRQSQRQAVTENEPESLPDPPQRKTSQKKRRRPRPRRRRDRESKGRRDRESKRRREDRSLPAKNQEDEDSEETGNNNVWPVSARLSAHTLKSLLSQTIYSIRDVIKKLKLETLNKNPLFLSWFRGSKECHSPLVQDSDVEEFEKFKAVVSIFSSETEFLEFLGLFKSKTPEEDDNGPSNVVSHIPQAAFRSYDKVTKLKRLSRKTFGIIVTEKIIGSGVKGIFLECAPGGVMAHGNIVHILSRNHHFACQLLSINGSTGKNKDDQKPFLTDVKYACSLFKAAIDVRAPSVTVELRFFALTNTQAGSSSNNGPDGKRSNANQSDGMGVIVKSNNQVNQRGGHRAQPEVKDQLLDGRSVVPKLFEHLAGMFHPMCDSDTIDTWCANGGDLVQFSLEKAAGGNSFIRFLPAWTTSWQRVVPDAPIDNLLRFASLDWPHTGPALLDSWITSSKSQEMLLHSSRYKVPIHRILQKKRAQEEYAEYVVHSRSNKTNETNSNNQLSNVEGIRFPSGVDMASLFSARHNSSVNEQDKISSELMHSAQNNEPKRISAVRLDESSDSESEPEEAKNTTTGANGKPVAPSESSSEKKDIVATSGEQMQKEWVYKVNTYTYKYAPGGKLGAEIRHSNGVWKIARWYDNKTLEKIVPVGACLKQVDGYDVANLNIQALVVLLSNKVDLNNSNLSKLSEKEVVLEWVTRGLEFKKSSEASDLSKANSMRDEEEAEAEAKEKEKEQEQEAEEAEEQEEEEEVGEKEEEEEEEEVGEKGDEEEVGEQEEEEQEVGQKEEEEQEEHGDDEDETEEESISREALGAHDGASSQSIALDFSSSDEDSVEEVSSDMADEIKPSTGRLSSLGISMIRHGSSSGSEVFSDENSMSESDQREDQLDANEEEDTPVDSHVNHDWTEGNLRMLRGLAKSYRKGKTQKYRSILRFLNRSEEECRARMIEMGLDLGEDN